MPKIEVPDSHAVAVADPPKVKPPGSKPERKRTLLENALMRHDPKPVNEGDIIEYLPPITFIIDGDLVMAEQGYGQEDQIRIANEKYKGRPSSQITPDDMPSWPLSSLLYEMLVAAMEPDEKARPSAFNSLVDQVTILQADRGGHLNLGKVKISIEFSALKE